MAQRGAVRAAYGQSVAYSLGTIVTFVRAATRPESRASSCSATTSPPPIVSGPDASHDVPISVIAQDPAVLARIDGWDWSDGVKPGPAAPVWPMDQFRDRFLRGVRLQTVWSVNRPATWRVLVSRSNTAVAHHLRRDQDEGVSA